MFHFIKDKLKKIYSSVTQNISALFSKPQLTQESISELKSILLQADTGVQTTQKIIAHVQDLFAQGKISEGKDLYTALEKYLVDILEKETDYNADIYILVGINGSGKTTFCAKLAQLLKQNNHPVILAAADTFRAAATEQLASWAAQSNTQLIQGKQGQDPASVVFAACEKLKENPQTKLIIDTAGRLQTKEYLMRELEKMKRVITKQFPDKKIKTLLTVDAMLGQNSFQQAKVFHEAVQLDGIILTKLDGTGKGGIVFSIVDELQIPIWYISFGEKIEDAQTFNAQNFVQKLLQKQ